MKITVETISHSEQRYETSGDWWFTEEGDLEVRVSDLGDWREEAALALHEIVEVCLCGGSGVPQEVVDKFDLKYEADRKKGKHEGWEEPGDDPKAPYHIQHGFASAVERMFIAACGLNWKEYNDKVMEL